MRRAFASAVLFVGVAAVAVVACKKDSAGPGGAASGAPSGSGAGGGGRGGGRGGRGGGAGGAFNTTQFPVDVYVVETKKIDYQVNAPGTVDAFESVQVTARVGGVVDRVAFKEGQLIKKGDVLVVIDGERFQLSVNSARAALEKSQAAQGDIEAMIARREGASTTNPGLIPGEELASYRTKGLTAKADTAVSREALRGAELNLRDANVRAPMAGVIQTRTVQTGQYVQAGYVMATLLQNDPMLLHFEVTPQEAPRLKVGMEVEFKLRESQSTYTAKVTLVSGSAESDTHMVPVTAQVDDNGHKYWLRPGSFCDVTVHVGAQREAPLVPRAAVRATERGLATYIVENDIAKEKIVTLGMTTPDGWVEVRSGLAGGDRLVVRGGESLNQGAKVKPNIIGSAELTSKSAVDAGAPKNQGGGPDGQDDTPGTPDAPANPGIRGFRDGGAGAGGRGGGRGGRGAGGGPP